MGKEWCVFCCHSICLLLTRLLECPLCSINSFGRLIKRMDYNKMNAGQYLGEAVWGGEAKWLRVSHLTLLTQCFTQQGYRVGPSLSSGWVGMLGWTQPQFRPCGALCVALYSGRTEKLGRTSSPVAEKEMHVGPHASGCTWDRFRGSLKLKNSSRSMNSK